MLLIPTLSIFLLTFAIFGNTGMLFRTNFAYVTQQIAQNNAGYAACTCKDLMEGGDSQDETSM